MSVTVFDEAELVIVIDDCLGTTLCKGINRRTDDRGTREGILNLKQFVKTTSCWEIKSKIHGKTLNTDGRLLGV